jgi:hypothetical protein
MANNFQESGLTIFSYPNFLCRLYLTQHVPNDPYFSQQWNFYNTGQADHDGHRGTPGADIKATEAWSIERGNSLIWIAVIDEGITSNHADLPNSRQIRLNGSNFSGVGSPNDPSPDGNGAHGDACAGLVAATQDNNMGISGLAPNCKILAEKLYDSVAMWKSSSDAANSIAFAYTNGADVISISWVAGRPPNAYPAIVTAIQNATTLGRNGRGCVVVCSTGNTASHDSSNNGYVQFPGNVRISGVLTVGASDRFDKQANYSPTTDTSRSDTSNDSIDVVAPSHRSFPDSFNRDTETLDIWSMDIPGLKGFNPWVGDGKDTIFPPSLGERLPDTGVDSLDFTGRFGGTSAAVPQVAGLAALILSLNPKLTQQQVYNIITQTADTVGGYHYSSHYSLELGYGRINACHALDSALELDSILSPYKFVCTSPDTLTIPYLQSGQSITWTVSSLGQINRGQGTDTVVVQRISNTTTGSITVTATVATPCGNVTLQPLYLTSGYSNSDYPVQGPSSACNNQNVSYSTNNLPRATYYKWFWPSGWTYYSGQGTSSINLRTGTFSGTVGVRVETLCDSGGTPGYVYTNIVSCAKINKDTSNFEIFPNPTSNKITIQTKPQVKGNSTIYESPKRIRCIYIFDSKGIIRKFYYNLTGLSVIELDVTPLKAGSYIVEIITESSGAESKKLIIIH